MCRGHPIGSRRIRGCNKQTCTVGYLGQPRMSERGLEARDHELHTDTLDSHKSWSAISSKLSRLPIRKIIEKRYFLGLERPQIWPSAVQYEQIGVGAKRSWRCMNETHEAIFAYVGRHPKAGIPRIHHCSWSFDGCLCAR